MAMASSTILEEVLQDELYEQRSGKTLNNRLIPVMKHAYFLAHGDSVKSNSDLLVGKKEDIRGTLLELQPGTKSGLFWMMTSRESKENAEKAFNELQQLTIDGEYEQTIFQTEAQLEAIGRFWYLISEKMQVERILTPAVRLLRDIIDFYGVKGFRMVK